MKRLYGFALAVILLTVLLGSCYRMVPESWSESATSIPDSSVLLPDFTYTGSQTCHIALSSASLNEIGANIITFFTDIVPGTADIVFSPIYVANQQNGSDLWLFAASDVDSSGTITFGDIVMPALRFNLKQDEDLALPVLTFDVADTLTTGTYEGHMWNLYFGNHSSQSVSGTSPLILRLDSVNGDFTDIVDRYKEFRFTDDTYSALGVYDFPNITADYYYILFIDTNNNGTPDAGEPSSITEPVSAVTGTVHYGVNDYETQSFELFIEPGQYLQ